MSIWFRRMQGIDSQTMRDIAELAAVEWDYQAIGYRSRGIGFIDGDESDADAIQDAAQELLGYRPVQIDEPEKSDGGESDEA